MTWRFVLILALVFANGFFVAAEFAIVTVRKTRIDQLIAEGHGSARAVRRAITDPRGLGGAVTLAAYAEDHLVRLASGDVRKAPASTSTW